MKLLPILAVLATTGMPVLAAEPGTLKLWPGGAPEPADFKIEAEKEIPKKNDADVKRVTNVSEPTLTIYKAEKPNGTCVIVAPGGGYSILASEHEGSQVCEYLNTLGVTCALLK